MKREWIELNVESQNGPYFHSINSLKPSQLLPFHLHITSTSLHLPHYWVITMLFQSLSILNILSEFVVKL
jgi:hypothetical protein